MYLVANLSTKVTYEVMKMYTNFHNSHNALVKGVLKYVHIHDDLKIRTLQVI